GGGEPGPADHAGAARCAAGPRSGRAAGAECRRSWLGCGYAGCAAAGPSARGGQAAGAYRWKRRGREGAVMGMPGRRVGGVRVVAGLLLVVGMGAVAGAEQGDPSAPSPGRGLLPNGRLLHPAGELVAVGNFPTGGAATPDGRFYWTVSTGRGYADVRIVSLE